MSHDRGCYLCGKERWEYKGCTRKDCAKRSTPKQLDIEIEALKHEIKDLKWQVDSEKRTQRVMRQEVLRCVDSSYGKGENYCATLLDLRMDIKKQLDKFK